MASSREYLRFVLDQLSDVEGIASRPMMGEYLLYVRGRLFGGVYDDRLLVKPVPAALSRIERAGKSVVYERPYEGAKEMIFIEDLDDRAYLAELVDAMYGDLLVPRRKKNRQGNIDNDITDSDKTDKEQVQG